MSTIMMKSENNIDVESEASIIAKVKDGGDAPNAPDAPDAPADAISVHGNNFKDEEIRNDTENGGEKEKVAKYPADCYSFMTIHGPFDGTVYFYFGFLVWSFQITFLMLFLLRVASPKLSTTQDSDNPDDEGFFQFMHAGNSGLTRATQYMALLSYCVFADESVKDVVTAVETFPMFSRVQPGDRVNNIIFSCFLRFTQGVLATIVVFLLVITSQDVIDIILNFTAVNFISGFDDVAFELAQWGKYGPNLEAEAHRIEELPAPACIYRKYQHVRYRYTVLPIAFTLLLSLTGTIIGQNSFRHWRTERLRVQFMNDPFHEKYNGCYNIDNSVKDTRGLFESFDANEAQAKFGYCEDTKKWSFFTGVKKSACEIEEDKIIAYSAKSYTFDISSVFEEAWTTRTGTPLQLYFFDQKKIDLTGPECESFIGDGKCDDEFFNFYEYNYDGGDCCSATCNGPDCGIRNIDEIFKYPISANGYPSCKDPDMYNITIEFNNIYAPLPSPFEEILPTDPFANEEPLSPLLILACDEKDVLMFNVHKGMEFETETVQVADGADCKMSIKNVTGAYLDIYYVNYTIYHGNKDSLNDNPIVILQADSIENSDSFFERIPECFFTKLNDYIDNTTIYTGNDPSHKAIDWLMEDRLGHSNCAHDTFLDRYALAAINFAAPDITINNETEDIFSDGMGLWIERDRQCKWKHVACTGGNVTELDLGGNTEVVLSGKIPTELGLLKNLLRLDMGDNQIYGSIPSELGQWHRLENFVVEKNLITGTIPTELGKLTNLKVLGINGNELIGTIPTEVGEMTLLKAFFIGGNEIRGSIPTEIGSASFLEFFGAGENLLTGNIPSVLGTLKKLTYIRSVQNSLSGTIPSELGQLTHLEVFQIGLNELKGSIPVGLLSNSFQDFDIYGNNLSDLTPVEGWEICSAEGGEVYCDCAKDCTVKPQQCGCEKAQSCCDSFKEQFTPCVVCSSSEIGNPDVINEILEMSCQNISDRIELRLSTFGTEETCSQGRQLFKVAGCFCTDWRTGVLAEDALAEGTLAEDTLADD